MSEYMWFFIAYGVYAVVQVIIVLKYMAEVKYWEIREILFGIAVAPWVTCTVTLDYLQYLLDKYVNKVIK